MSTVHKENVKFMRDLKAEKFHPVANSFCQDKIKTRRSN